MGKGVRRKHKVSIFVLFQINYEQEDWFKEHSVARECQLEMFQCKKCYLFIRAQ